LSINIVKQISEYLSPIEADAIFGIDIICNIKPQAFKGVHSEWLKLLNSDRAQNLALTPASILTPDYNSTASLFKENLDKLKTIFNLGNNPIESICDALEANNSQQLEPLLEIALKTTYFVESDSACLTNARYKKIVKNSNTLKTLLKNNASAEEIREHLEQPKDIAINIADNYGNTILHDLKVVPNEDRTVEKLDILIAYDVDINAQNAIGETFAHYAAKLGPDEYIEILTDYVDFNFTLKNFYGKTPLHYFVGSRVDSLDENVVKFLTQPQQQLPFIGAENSIIAKKAVAKGYQVDTEKDNNGFTAIDRVYYDYQARMDLEDALLETTVQSFSGNRWQSKYFDEKIYSYADKEGNIRLHRLAAKGANAYLIYRIIEDSKDYINAKNNKNETPLHVAIKNNMQYSMDPIITLVCSGADLFLKDNNSENPLDLLNKCSEGSLVNLFNTNAPIKSILIKAINEFKKQNPDNLYKFLEQALANPWDDYKYNEYDSDSYDGYTENYDDVEANNGCSAYFFSKTFNFMENPAEASDSEGNDAEEGELEGSELEDNDAEGGELEVSELEDNQAEEGELEVSELEGNHARNQILGKRFCALDNNSESAANKRQKTEAANPEEPLQDNYDSMNHADIIQLDVTIELGGAMNNYSQYK
jgi:ankyrin repeat protein